MIDTFIGTATTLPVEISYTSWNDACLVISGTSWKLQVWSDWRLYSKDELLCQSNGVGTEQALQVLHNKKLISIEKIQGTMGPKSCTVMVQFTDENYLKAFGDGDIYFGV